MNSKIQYNGAGTVAVGGRLSESDGPFRPVFPQEIKMVAHPPIRTLLPAVIVIALLLALVPLPAAAQSAATTCGPYVATDDIRRGMQGYGMTVRSGGTPERFGVEVLGVLADALAPGRDMIIVDVSGSVVDAAGGTLWAGASGSPVYVGDRLLGAVAYGLSFGPSTITGLTPAEDMLGILDYRSGSALQSADAGSTPKTADNPSSMRDTIAERYGIAPSQVSGTFTQLKTPLSISGASRRSVEGLGAAARRAGTPLIPHLGGSASSAATSASATPRPGGNFAAALSYGDITAAGIGTTTLVCDGRALAFGHPFSWSGATVMGANDAEAITVVDDPAFGAYKLANVAGGFGTVDQDRLAGIRATLGTMPAGIPVTTNIEDLDLDRSRTGRSRVITPDAVPMIGLAHALTNMDVVADRIGQGSASLTWRISGTRADGQSWTLERENRYASQYDISFEAVWEFLSHLAVITENPFEDVAFSSIRLSAEMEEAVRRYTVTGVEVGTPDGEYIPVAEGEYLHAEPGTELPLRVTLQPYKSATTSTVELAVQIPQDAYGDGTLEVGSGAADGFDPFVCVWEPQLCGDGAADGFAGLLDDLASRPTNDELVASLRLYGFGGPLPDAPEDEPRPVADEPTATTTVLLDQVVSGIRSFPIFVGQSGGLERVAGDDRIATAAAVSLAAFPEGAPAAVIARADEPTDALSAGPLAASLDGPVLLSATAGLSAATADELQRLGVQRVVLLGGPTALSEAVADGVRALAVPAVERVAGADRFATAREVATRVGGPRVYLTGPDSWPDAVAVSGLAAFDRAPLLLADEPQATAAAVMALGAQAVTIVGGPASVPNTFVTALQQEGIAVDRIHGADRYETSLRIAERSSDHGADMFNTWVVTGGAFPDALATSAVAAHTGGVVLLVDGDDLERSAPSREWLSRLPGGPFRVRLVGGPSAIDFGVEEQIAEILFGFGPPPPGGEPMPPPVFEDVAYPAG